MKTIRRMRISNQTLGLLFEGNVPQSFALYPCDEKGELITTQPSIMFTPENSNLEGAFEGTRIRVKPFEDRKDSAFPRVLVEEI